jgi:hypothetical protein
MSKNNGNVYKPTIITFHIVGMSPLLQNNPLNFIGGDEQASLAAKKKYNDEEEARLRLYITKDGHYYHPSISFLRSMAKAVSGLKYGKVSAPMLIRGSVFVAHPQTILLDLDGNPAKDYLLDKQPVVVSHARIARVRPMWPEWQCDLSLEVDVARITEDQVRAALELAGRIIGVGDFRPEKGGPYGRFRVE